MAVTTIAANNNYAAASIISYLDLNIKAGDIVDLVFNPVIASIGGTTVVGSGIRYCNFIQ